MYRYLLIIISFLMMAACVDLPVDNSYANDRISSSNSLPSQRPNDQSLIEIVRQLDEIQRQVGQIQGQTEDLAYQSQTTQERQRALYIDLDDRLQDLERSISALNTMNVVNEEEIVFGELPVPGGTDEENYAAAFELLKEQNYELASLAFIRFMTAYPGSSLIDNAPRKIPDALLKIGYCNFELGNFSEARLVLMRTQNNYPQSTAAKNAEQRIKIMDDRGI